MNMLEHTALARLSDPATSARDTEWLEFRLGDEHFGVDLLRVQEIRGYERPTRVATAPRSMLGILNLRGVIVPVIDARHPVGEHAVFDARTVTIVLNLQRGTVAIVVDAVLDVLHLSYTQILPVPTTLSTMDPSTIAGLASLPGAASSRLVALLDIEHFLRAV